MSSPCGSSRCSPRKSKIEDVIETMAEFEKSQTVTSAIFC